ncbi:MAG: molecular chaperone HtpG [Elusimicrobia bacterium GWA2_69_24]|nr:MAG: molecular chaperone HtpG [Elusimicrobia bacterium GWA2_69_24]HBL16403.1 molecular chaperone HtpG [Elusimicrobiota bacterium]
MTQTVEKIDFQAEVRQVLDIVIHSLYTRKEIFLRELLSNASDALDKRRFLSLTQGELAPKGGEYEIMLEADKEKRTLTVRDNGIGMNREDLIANIGTIAKSGTQEFLKAVRARQGTESAPELIGQFGVGFYAAFMVADTVTVTTRKAGEAAGWVWRSQGEGGFTLEPAEGELPVGTAVTLSLKKLEEGDAGDFADALELKRIVKRYSDFIGHPIRLGDDRTPVNSMKAIWTRAAKDITPEEHAEFYKHISHDWTPPLDPIRFSAEGASLRYDALLYLPGKALMDLFYPDRRGGLHFFVKRVLIMDDCQDLTPDYLRFVRGVVDCPDVSLNISRENMQQNRQISQIRERVVRKTLDALKAMAENEAEKYRGFWGEFGKVLKEGIYNDPENRDRIRELMLFESSAVEPGKWTSFKEYAGRMKEGQKDIYYLTGESRSQIENSPHLEALKAKGYEVVFFTDPVDEIVLEHLEEAEGKKLRSALKGDLGLEGDKAALEKTEKECRDLVNFLEEKLKEHVKAVRFSDRLTESAVCLVAEEHGMSARLEKLLRQNQAAAPAAKRILELNAKHPVIQRMKAMFDADPKDPRLSDYAALLYGQGALTEGSPLPDPARYARLVAELMSRP